MDPEKLLIEAKRLKKEAAKLMDRARSLEAQSRIITREQEELKAIGRREWACYKLGHGGTTREIAERFGISITRAKQIQGMWERDRNREARQQAHMIPYLESIINNSK